DPQRANRELEETQATTGFKEATKRGRLERIVRRRPISGGHHDDSVCERCPRSPVRWQPAPLPQAGEIEALSRAIESALARQTPPRARRSQRSRYRPRRKRRPVHAKPRRLQ